MKNHLSTLLTSNTTLPPSFFQAWHVRKLQYICPISHKSYILSFIYWSNSLRSTLLVLHIPPTRYYQETMIWPPKTRKHGRNGSRNQAYVSYANIFVVPLVQSLPTPQTTPEPVTTRDEGLTMENPKPIPVVRLSKDSHCSNNFTIPSIETEMGAVKVSGYFRIPRKHRIVELQLKVSYTCHYHHQYYVVIEFPYQTPTCTFTYSFDDLMTPYV